MFSVDFVAAFLIGFVGSLHCVGMCGPIVIALPSGNRSRIQFLFSRLIYNLGRILTYAFLGILVGFIGQTINVGAYQQTLSIICGALLIAFAIFPKILKQLPLAGSLSNKLTGHLKKLWGKFFGQSSNSSLFVIGLLNGFLPCGLVYVALTGASLTGEPSAAALFMLLFGLGTVPIMLATSILGRLAGVGLKRRMSMVLPVMTVLLGVLLILRGLSLGIPYISPKISDTDGKETIQCCPVDSTKSLNLDSIGTD